MPLCRLVTPPHSLTNPLCSISSRLIAIHFSPNKKSYDYCHFTNLRFYPSLKQRFLIASGYDVQKAVDEYSDNNGRLQMPEIADPELELNSEIEYEVGH